MKANRTCKGAVRSFRSLKPFEPMNVPPVTYELGTQQGQAVIFIRFDYNAQLIERVKKLIGVRWSPDQKAWYVRDTVSFREKFGLPPKPVVGKSALLHLRPVNQAALLRLVETLQLKSYSPNTINSYRNGFATQFCHPSPGGRHRHPFHTGIARSQ